MNIKAYIDYFDEISDLPREQQFTLLEKAYQLILEESAISKFSMVSFLVPLLSIAFLVGGGVFLLGASVVVILICIIFSLLLSRVLVNEITTSMLKRGLTRVINTEGGAAS